MRERKFRRKFRPKKLPPRCPCCHQILRKYSTYVDLERGEIIHKDCGYVLEEKLLTTHRGIQKGRSR